MVEREDSSSGEEGKRETMSTLKEQTEAAHAWIDGMPYAGGGHEFHGERQCSVCGLVNEWGHDEQNNTLYDYYITISGRRTSLLAAATCPPS